jgi:hypothetical protein
LRAMAESAPAQDLNARTEEAREGLKLLADYL